MLNRRNAALGHAQGHEEPRHCRQRGPEAALATFREVAAGLRGSP